MRIVFMGTPDFAVASLRALVENDYNVVAVITMPDKPAGRGHKLQQSAVKQYAVEHGLPVLQPEKLKDEAFIEELRSYRADLQIVVAFRMLPEVVWSMPPMGTFNLHGSLLPQYRGAAPINWAIINGDTETGATTFFLQHEIDTGNIIMQEKISVDLHDNVGVVYDRLMHVGAELVTRTVDLILTGHVPTVPQVDVPVDELRAAPKIFKETCEIDFAKPCIDVHNFVRGLSPYPGAWCVLDITEELRGQTVKLFKAVPLHEEHDFAPGLVLTDKKKYLRVTCAEGFLEILELQLPGKKRMDVKAVLNGLK